MWKRSLTAALVVGCSGAIIGLGHAHAVLESLKWPYSGGYNLVELYYVNKGDSFLAPLADNAATQWSGQPDPVVLNKSSSGSITISSGSPQCGNCGGWTSIYGSNGTMTSANIVMNEPYLQASSSPYQSGLVIHEFGHAAGLWHSDGTGCTSVMYSSLTLAHASTSIAAYDVSELNRDYPNPNWPPSGAC